MVDFYLVSEKNESIILNIHNSDMNILDLQTNKTDEIIICHKKFIGKVPLLSGFNALQLYSNMYNFTDSIGEAIKKNIILYPFKFNFLHIGAILGGFKEISENKFDWSQFDTLKIPIFVFNSRDYQEQTCLDIILMKKDKTLLKHYLEVLFKAFENDFDLEFDNHFYQMLKFYSNNFKTKSLFYFLAQLIEIFGEETGVLIRLFDFMFIEADKNIFLFGISERELEKPLFLATDKFGWLQDKDQVLERINKPEGEGIFSCLKKREKNEKKADILCKIFMFKGLTEINEESIQFWENLLKLEPENKIFDNQNLNIIAQYKWDTYIRTIYLKDLVGYLIFFFFYLANFIFLVPDRIIDNDNLNGSEIVSIVLNICDLIYFFIYGFQEVKQAFMIGPLRYFSSFWNYIDVLVILDVLSTTILDIIYIFWGESFPYSIKILVSVTLLFLWARLLSYSKGIEGTGFLIRLVEQVILDMKFFLIFIFLTMLAFTSAGFVLQSTSNNESQFSVFNLIYRLMLGDFTNFDQYIQEQESYMPLWIGMILFTIFLSIIMLNLLISIIGDTYGKVVTAEKSNRTYEILNVIYEIEKFKILGSNEYVKLKEGKIIGDYLICFHNFNHFQRNNICLENEELSEKIMQLKVK